LIRKKGRVLGAVNVNCDLLVVGGGLAGLACARSAALGGLRVVLVEKQPQLGGHLLPFSRGALKFEVGLHYIADCGIGSRWKDALDRLQISLPTEPLDHFFERVRNEKTGEEWALPANLKEALALFGKRHPEHAAPGSGWDRLGADLELVWESALRTPFPSDAIDLGKIVVKSRDPLRLMRIAGQSALQYLKSDLHLSASAIEDVLFQHVLLGVSPERLSALVFLLVHRYYYERPCFIRGGGQAFRDALLHDNVQYLTDSPVHSIQDQSRHFAPRAHTHTGTHAGLSEPGSFRYRVEAGEHVVHCRDIVFTGDPKNLAQVCKFSLPILLRIRLARAQAPHALVVGYFATRRPLGDLGFRNANYWLHGGYSSQEAYRERDVFKLAQFAPLYLSMGSLRDPLRGESAGVGEFQAMFLTPPCADVWMPEGVGRSTSWAQHEQSLAAYRVSGAQAGYRRHYLQVKKSVLSHLEERLLAQFPVLKGELSWSELGTPLTHHRYLATSTLGGYGYEASVSDVLWGRPGWKSGRPGLYLAGAFTRPSHGILTSLLNGVGVGERVLALATRAPKATQLSTGVQSQKSDARASSSPC
jgi:all-trans-retinol 13,14-reductase